MSLYEQIKDDLGYLRWGRAVECFAALAEQARRDGWSHVEFLARLAAEQADAPRNRRLAARLRHARFPLRDAWLARVTWIAPGERRKETRTVQAPTMAVTRLRANRLERRLRSQWTADAAARARAQRRWYRRKSKGAG